MQCNLRKRLQELTQMAVHLLARRPAWGGEEQQTSVAEVSPTIFAVTGPRHPSAARNRKGHETAVSELGEG